jgi:hypothetical protein
MSSEDEARRQPFRLREEPIGFLDRLSLSIQVIISTVMVVITAILMLPINFLSALFTTKRKVIEVSFTGGQIPGEPNPQNPDDGEDWKQAHNEQAGA